MAREPLPRINFDAYDFEFVAKHFQHLPREMQQMAFGRAAARVKQVVNREYAKLASAHTKMPQHMIIPHLVSRLSGGTVTLRVKTNFMPLEDFGAKQTPSGVFVRGRGTYKGNFFIPNSAARRAAGYVLLRESAAKRTPTHRVFGPNPANAALNNVELYEGMLSDIASGEFRTVIIQQIQFLMARTGRKGG